MKKKVKKTTPKVVTSQSPRQRNVIFLASPHKPGTVQTFRWAVPVTDMIFQPTNVGREHQMVDLLMNEEFSKCITHYQKLGKVSRDTVYEFADMFVAAPELGGTRPQIHQVHVFDQRIGMITDG